jgi:hypothetical protein
MFRFTTETAEMLKAASDRAGMSKTVYLMLALKHQFQADGLLPPSPILLLPHDRRTIEKRGHLDAMPASLIGPRMNRSRSATSESRTHIDTCKGQAPAAAP